MSCDSQFADVAFIRVGEAWAQSVTFATSWSMLAGVADPN